MKKLNTLFLTLFLALAANAQIQFVPTFGTESLQLNKTYFFNKEDSISFSSFRFYISNLEVSDNKGQTKSSQQRHFLIDLDDSESLNLELKEFNMDEIKDLSFLFGVDSLTNASGAQGGDLDPMNGMYWSWQSGYINFKLEGNSNTCPARKNKFQFHLGGFLAPYNPIQLVELKLEPSNTLQIEFDVAKFIKLINIESNYQIMSPSAEAVELSKIAASIFRIQP